jgi:hypothetical protein
MNETKIVETKIVETKIVETKIVELKIVSISRTVFYCCIKTKAASTSPELYRLKASAERFLLPLKSISRTIFVTT